MRVLPADTSRYPFELPNFDPPVIISYGAANPNFCDRLHAATCAAAQGDSGVFGQDKSQTVNTYHRSSTYCMLPDNIVREAVDFQTNLVRSFIAHQLPNGVRDIKLYETLQFLRYDEVRNGHFLPHTDSAYWDGQGKFQHTSPGRMVTSILYINDDYEGGELILNSVRDERDQPIMVKPKKGLIVIFPADVRFMHEVKPVTKGVRYSIVGWFDFVRV